MNPIPEMVTITTITEMAITIIIIMVIIMGENMTAENILLKNRIQQKKSTLLNIRPPDILPSIQRLILLQRSIQRPIQQRSIQLSIQNPPTLCQSILNPPTQNQPTLNRHLTLLAFFTINR